MGSRGSPPDHGAGPALVPTRGYPAPCSLPPLLLPLQSLQTRPRTAPTLPHHTRSARCPRSPVARHNLPPHSPRPSRPWYDPPPPAACPRLRRPSRGRALPLPPPQLRTVDPRSPCPCWSLTPLFLPIGPRIAVFFYLQICRKIIFTAEKPSDGSKLRAQCCCVRFSCWTHLVT